jgi:hypothetical protein
MEKTKMYKLYSKNGNYYVEVEALEEKPSVSIRVKDGVQEKMVDDETTDKQRIKRSIEKWEFIACLYAFGISVWQDGGRTTCALCMKYDPWVHDCVGCPISSFTGRKGCSDTPYEQFIDVANDAAWTRLLRASEEVEFLKSLLEKEQDCPF